MNSMIATWIILLLIAALVALTVLPITNSRAWWIRSMDFPRIQILVGAFVILALCWFLSGWVQIAALIVTLACGAYQTWYIFPYTPLGRKEIRLAPPGRHQISLLSSNVLMENESHDKLIALIDRVDPDILLLMETDETWLDAMEPTLARYGTVVREPRSNYYGMIFASRLPVTDVRVVYLVDDETPTLFAQIEGPEGRVFRFVGVHPKPPVPGEDTDERDAQIAFVARFARKTDMPVIIMGDFNDVAWSHLAQRFKRVGMYLDPRLGRGPLPSFDANSRLMRFPIDQLYITENLALVSFERAESIGSDHFPMIAQIRLDRELAKSLNATPKPLDEAEKEQIEEQMRSLTRVRDIDPLKDR